MVLFWVGLSLVSGLADLSSGLVRFWRIVWLVGDGVVELGSLFCLSVGWLV